jgi:hypothetical protein
MTKHLVVGDYHTYDGDNLRRFTALGNLIVAEQPDAIIFMGDQADMASLCSYDKGRKDMVFKNVKKDIEAMHIAEKEIFKPLLSMNKSLAIKKRKQYTPLVVKVLGNHEYRVQRLLDYHPEWEGSVSMDSFATRLNINEIVVPFKEYINVDDIHYSHIWASGVMGRPFASARAMIAKRGVSCTMGDTHTLDVATLSKPDGSRIRGLVAGSFHDPEYASFAGPQVDNIWYNGVMLKHNVKAGDYDLQEISVERLLEEYGS